MLSGVGIDLSNETVQEMLPQLATAGGWPAGLADTIAGAGVWMESVYESATTRDAVATLADVEAAFAWNFLNAVSKGLELIDYFGAGHAGFKGLSFTDCQ